jgi:SAM-dependent methyltransferase
MTEPARQEFDDYASSYETVINDYVGFSGQSQDFYTRAKAIHLCEILDAQSRAKKIDVLDIGCGHGLIHPYLSGSGYQLTGIDVAESAIALARQINPGVTYDVYDGLRLPYPDESFDALFTICVMHHVPIEQWGAFVEEGRRVLRPGGTFIIFEHNKLNPVVRWVVSRIPIDRNAVLLTSHRTRKLMQDAGLRNVRCKHILFFPSDRAILRKIESGLAWLPMGAQYYVTGTKST